MIHKELYVPEPGAHHRGEHPVFEKTAEQIKAAMQDRIHEMMALRSELLEIIKERLQRTGLDTSIESFLKRVQDRYFLRKVDEEMKAEDRAVVIKAQKLNDLNGQVKRVQLWIDHIIREDTLEGRSTVYLLTFSEVETYFTPFDPECLTEGIGEVIANQDRIGLSNAMAEGQYARRGRF
jgi:hypothetical protein